MTGERRERERKRERESRSLARARSLSDSLVSDEGLCVFGLVFVFGEFVLFYIISDDARRTAGATLARMFSETNIQTNNERRLSQWLSKPEQMTEGFSDSLSD